MTLGHDLGGVDEYARAADVHALDTIRFRNAAPSLVAQHLAGAPLGRPPAQAGSTREPARTVARRLANHAIPDAVSTGVTLAVHLYPIGTIAGLGTRRSDHGSRPGGTRPTRSTASARIWVPCAPSPTASSLTCRLKGQARDPGAFRERRQHCSGGDRRPPARRDQPRLWYQAAVSASVWKEANHSRQSPGSDDDRSPCRDGSSRQESGAKRGGVTIKLLIPWPPPAGAPLMYR
jgi:hypothetical protein